VDVEARVQALKLRVAGNPNIKAKDVEEEVRALMALGVRCRRFSDEVGLSNYVIYKIRKDAGIARPPRPHKKFREVKLKAEPVPAESEPVTFNITIKLIQDDRSLEVTGECMDVAALVRGVLGVI